MEKDSGYFPYQDTENVLEKLQQYNCERVGLAYWTWIPTLTSRYKNARN